MGESDRTREDEWFLRNEAELLEAARKARAKRERERADAVAVEERQRLKALHHMCCPKCGQGMAEETLEGITVDRCTACEGVYFDAGELDQLFLKKQGEQKGFLAKLLKL